jgi:predicted Zn-dependent protease
LGFQREGAVAARIHFLAGERRLARAPPPPTVSRIAPCGFTFPPFIMKKLRLAFVLSTALAFASCAVVPETGRRQLMLVSPNEEARMGLAAFSQIKQQEKVSSDPAANARVKRVGERIAKSVGRELPNAQWEFVVFDSEQVNAFALPGGKVGVYTGLLKLAANDDEIAAVMGHEVAHVTSRHGAERTSQNYAVAGVGLAALIGMEAGDVDPEKRNLALAAYGLGSAVGFMLPFSRLHESEADAVGLRFAAGAGYDPRAAITFWQKMAAANRGAARPPVWFSTHPSDEQRIANLQKLAPQYVPLYESSRGQY